LHSCEPCCHFAKNGSWEQGETAGAFGYTPLSPHSHVVPCAAASLVARAARGRSGGGTAPGGQRRARLADAMARHGTIVARLQHKSHECHRERRTPALKCSWCRHAQVSCREQSFMERATMSLQAAAQHAHAAEQYGHAARHYKEAVAHHQVGHYQQAAQHVQTARGHHAHAAAHASAAATCHAAHDGQS
jgi:hypothetical protein